MTVSDPSAIRFRPNAIAIGRHRAANHLPDQCQGVAVSPVCLSLTMGSLVAATDLAGSATRAASAAIASTKSFLGYCFIPFPPDMCCLHVFMVRIPFLFVRPLVVVMRVPHLTILFDFMKLHERASLFDRLRLARASESRVLRTACRRGRVGRNILRGCPATPRARPVRVARGFALRSES